MSGFTARWSVTRTYDVRRADVARDGCIDDSSLERWVDGVSTTYLDGCTALHQWCARSGLRIVTRALPLPPAAALGTPTVITASAGVTEIRPSAFTLAVRIRGDGSGAEAIETRRAVSARDPVTGRARRLPRAVQDELIGRAKRASLLN